MTREQEIFKQSRLLFLLGFALLAVVFGFPDAGWYQHSTFFTVARHANWLQPLDFSAAWCSIKIILLGIGMFFLIESLGTILTLLKYKTLALTVFLMQFFSATGILFGTYYLFKSLI